MKRAAVILAGGRSERFQRTGEPWLDKALTAINGRTTLESIVVQLRDSVDEIAISVGDEQRRRSYMQVLPPNIFDDVRIFVDEVVSGGPLGGIATSVKHLDAKQVLVIPCDTPFLKPVVVGALFQRIGGNDAAIPMWSNGILEPLMAVYKGSRVRICSQMLFSSGRRRPSDLIRGSSRVTFVSIEKDLNVLDPEYRSFVNINYRKEAAQRLDAPLRSGAPKRTFTASISLIRDCDLRTVSNAVQAATSREDNWSKTVKPIMDYLQKRRGFFWLGFLAEETAKSLSERRGSHPKDQKELFEAAARAYKSETRIHSNHGLLALRAHTHLDGAWCWRKAHREDRSRSAFRAAAFIYAKLGLDARKSRTLSDHSIDAFR